MNKENFMKIKYEITGLDCPNCAAKLAAMIEGEEGIESAKINFLTEKLTVVTELSEDEAYKIISADAARFSKSVKISK